MLEPWRRKGTVVEVSTSLHARGKKNDSLCMAHTHRALIKAEALWVVPLTAAAAAEADKDSEANDAVSAIVLCSARALDPSALSPFCMRDRLS
jgi:hypothetical protein